MRPHKRNQNVHDINSYLTRQLLASETNLSKIFLNLTHHECHITVPVNISKFKTSQDFQCKEYSHETENTTEPLTQKSKSTYIVK